MEVGGHCSSPCLRVVHMWSQYQTVRFEVVPRLVCMRFRRVCDYAPWSCQQEIARGITRDSIGIGFMMLLTVFLALRTIAGLSRLIDGIQILRGNMSCILAFVKDGIRPPKRTMSEPATGRREFKDEQSHKPILLPHWLQNRRFDWATS
jgi:hypothetical protein